MADYVLLYSGGKMPEGKEEQDAVMAAWNAWFGELGGALKDARQPVHAGGQEHRIRRLGQRRCGSGPPSGYSIVTADSLDEAVEKAKGSRCCRAAPASRCTRPSR